MKIIHSDQYGTACVVPGPYDKPDAIMDECRKHHAVRRMDGVEFVVQLRDEVGPELWTEQSLRRSTPVGVPT